MSDKKFNRENVRAKNFGVWLEEAFQIMLDFTIENKFDCYSIQEKNQLYLVLEILTYCFDMWDKGQIILVSKESEDK